MSTNVGTVDFELLLNSNPFNKGLKNATNTIKSSGIESSLKNIGKLVLTAFSVKAVVDFGKQCVQTATETSNAWIGLNSILTEQGKSFNQAKNFINDYISDGLVPLNNAVGAYKNLALRGYNSDQIQKTMNALKNSATFARQSTYSLGDAVQTATEGLKNENSVVVDNAGVTKNVAKMWEDYAKSIGKTTNNLTQQEKIQAEVNGILEETKFQSNDAAIYANTFSGKLAQLNTAFTNMKTAIGNVIQPIAKIFIPIITQAANAVTYLFNKISSLLSIFGLKADSVENISNGIGDITSGATKASDAVSGIGSSAKKAAKDLKSLASFDTAQVLKNNDSDSDSSGGNSSGGTSGIDASEIGNSIISTSEIANAQIDGIIAKIKELSNIFKSGFAEGFGSFDFSKIINAIQRIKENIKSIFMSDEVLNAANDWVNVIILNLGRITGSIVSIGVTIADNLIGGIDLFLEQNKQNLQDHLVRLFDISSKSNEINGKFAVTIADIFSVFRGDAAKQATADIIAIFTDSFLGSIEVAGQVGNDILSVLIEPINKNKDLIKEALEGMLEPLSSNLETIKQGIQDTFSKFWEVYDTYIKPAVENIKNGFSNIVEVVLTAWNQNINPMIDELSKKFNELWTQHIQPMIDSFLEFIGKLINGTSELWKKYMQPFISWIISNIIPVISPILETVGNVFMNVVGYISDLLNGFWNILSGFIDFIVGVFTGDWSKAWNGIKQIFESIWNMMKAGFNLIWNSIKDILKGGIEWIKNGIKSWGTTISNIWSNIWNGIKSFVLNIWNGIKSVIANVINGIKNTISNILNGIKKIWNTIWTSLKTTVTNIFNGIWNTIKKIINSILGGIEGMANGVVNGVNTVIKALNKLKFDIPDWIPGLGGKKFGFNIGLIPKVSIPKLAEGGYVKANTPQLAMIGDNRHQGEVVAPEDKLMSLYKKANQEMGLGNNQKVIELLEKIIQILINLSLDFNLYIDGYELNKRLEKIKNKNRFATNGG